MSLMSKSSAPTCRSVVLRDDEGSLVGYCTDASTPSAPSSTRDLVSEQNTRRICEAALQARWRPLGSGSDAQ